MTLSRTLEPEVMETAEDAADYDAMDHSHVNRVFVQDWLKLLGRQAADMVLDVGTGTALIPIELCRQSLPTIVTAIDLGEAMLARGQQNIARAGFASRIHLDLADAKQLSFTTGAFAGVISNSIIHHIADPTPVLSEMRRVLAPGGRLLVRDLARPTSSAEVERLVQLYAGQDSPRQQQLFRQSLHAALTVPEVTALVQAASWERFTVTMTSDRHWTLTVA